MIDIEELFDARDTTPRRGADPIWFEAARRGPRASRASRGALVAAALVLVLGTAAAVLVVRSVETGTSRIDPASDVEAPDLRPVIPLGGVRSVEGFTLGPPTIEVGELYSRPVSRSPEGGVIWRPMQLIVRVETTDVAAALGWRGGSESVAGVSVDVDEGPPGGTSTLTWAPHEGLLAQLLVFPIGDGRSGLDAARTFVERADFDSDGSWATEVFGEWLAAQTTTIPGGRSFPISLRPAIVGPAQVAGTGDVEADLWVWREGFRVGDLRLSIRPAIVDPMTGSAAPVVLSEAESEISVRGVTARLVHLEAPWSVRLSWVERGLEHTLLAGGGLTEEDVLEVAAVLAPAPTEDRRDRAAHTEVPIVEWSTDAPPGFVTEP
jgi:hypothetical protein